VQRILGEEVALDLAVLIDAEQSSIWRALAVSRAATARFRARLSCRKYGQASPRLRRKASLSFSRRRRNIDFLVRISSLAKGRTLRPAGKRLKPLLQASL